MRRWKTTDTWTKTEHHVRASWVVGMLAGLMFALFVGVTIGWKLALLVFACSLAWLAHELSLFGQYKNNETVVETETVATPDPGWDPPDPAWHPGGHNL